MLLKIRKSVFLVMEQKLIAPAGGCAGGSGKGQTTVYMFLGHCPGHGCAHTLYAFEIPLNSYHLYLYQQHQPGRPLPILTFMEGDYPQHMSCVKLDSKLYFIGGLKRGRGDVVCTHPLLPRREVYILDLEKTLPKPGTPPGETSIYLEEGPAMTTGKKHQLAFAAVGKIFILSIASADGLTPCEVFTPGSSNGGGAGEWAELPSALFRAFLTGHVVVNDKAFITGHNNELYSFDLKSYKWEEIVTPPFFPGETSLFLDNKFYVWYCNPYSVYFQTLKFAPETKQLAGCGDWRTLDLGLDRVRTWSPSACFAHDDKTGRLYFLEVGCSPHPDYEDEPYLYHQEECVVKLHIFDSKSGCFLNAMDFIVSSQKAISRAVSAFVV